MSRLFLPAKRRARETGAKNKNLRGLRWHDLLKCAIERFRTFVHADFARCLDEALKLLWIGLALRRRLMCRRLLRCLRARHRMQASIAQARYMGRPAIAV